MDNFINHFKALESQAFADKVSLEELRRSNLMKEAVIFNMKKELARYRELDQVQNEKRGDVEHKHKIIMDNVAANLSRVKTLSSEQEILDAECVSQASRDAEVQKKLSAVRTQILKIDEVSKTLRDTVQDLKRPLENLADSLLTEMRAKEAFIRKEMSSRQEGFDLTAAVEVAQTIKSTRKERLAMSKELTAKSEILSNLEAENEMMESQLHKLQSQFSAMQKENIKLVEQRESHDRRLDEMLSQQADLNKILHSTMYDLVKVEQEEASKLQKLNEIENELSSAACTLEETKAQFLNEQEALKTLKEYQQSRKQQSTKDQELMIDDIKQKVKKLVENREICYKAVEDIKTEIEKMAASERFLVIYEQHSRDIVELQEKLSNLKNTHENLRKKLEEKSERESQQKCKLENLRQEVETKKQQVQKNIEEIQAQVEKLNIEILKEEARAEELKNKNFEIEGEIHLVKHQLSNKADELEIAKTNFHKNFSQPKGNQGAEKMGSEIRNPEETRKEILQRQEYAKNAGNVPEQPKNTKYCSGKQKSNRRNLQKQSDKLSKDMMRNQLATQCKRNNKDESGVKNNDVNRSRRDYLDQDLKKPKLRCTNDQSSLLQHTTTLASILAEDFKRDGTVHMDDAMEEEDDGGDLSGKLEKVGQIESFHLSSNIPAESRKMDSANRTEEYENAIHFEPSELFTSTPRNVKKQKNSFSLNTSILSPPARTSGPMSPLKTKHRIKTTEKTRGRSRGRGKRKH